MHALIPKVKKTLLQHGMCQPGEKVVVAVSGGADSMALLHVLTDIRRDFSLSLAVACLDHGLRPEAEEEKIFVAQAAADLGLPFFARKVDLRANRPKGFTLQEAAREARYAFLLEAAGKQKAARIALGHTADDQAESLLMRFLRGSGTRGLAGIPPVRQSLFIRPLIECWREEVEDYLREKGVSYLEDPSNRSLKFLRNRVRHELLPLLKRYNPRIKRTLVHMARLFRAEEDFWQSLMEEKFPPLVRRRQPDLIDLDIPSLLALPLPLRLRSFRHAIEEIKGDLRRVEFSHILALEGLVESREPNQSLSLPQGVGVGKSYQSLVFSRRQEEAGPFEYPVAGPGHLDIPEIGCSIRFEVKSPKLVEMQADSSLALMDFDEIDFPLTIRSFRPGDRLQPLGMEGEKKVKDLFIDSKIPAGQRKKIPLLFYQNRLLWVAGLRLDHRARVKPQTRRILQVELL